MSQVKDTTRKYSAYDLMSKYYNENFKPFKKRNVYIGLAFSLDDVRKENTSGLLQNVIDGSELEYSILLKGGYYIGNYAMVGLNFDYSQYKFDGQVFRDPDTLQSNSITRSYDFTPNFRSSIPLTRNERLSFFVEIGLTFGYGTTLVRNTKNLDEIEKLCKIIRLESTFNTRPGNYHRGSNAAFTYCHFKSVKRTSTS